MDACAIEHTSCATNQRIASEAVRKLPGNWTTSPPENADAGNAAGNLLDALRTGNSEDVCMVAVDDLVRGRARAKDVWDSIHLAAGELMMRQRGIFGIHTVTSANALHAACERSADPETQLLLLLQGLGWMIQFRNFMEKTPQKLGSADILGLKPVSTGAAPQAAVEEIFSTLRTAPQAAAEQAMALAVDDQQVDQFQRAARRLILQKAADPHDFKYAAAIFEDMERVSPRWKPQMLATAVYNLRGADTPDSPVMQRARAAVQGL